MKQVSIIFFSLLMFISAAKCQHAYYDAIELKTFISNKKFNTRFDLRRDTILEKYKTDRDQDIITEFQSNPFIKDYFPLVTTRSSLVSGALSTDQKVSSIGGLSIPNEILLGVTDWIVKRTKQELNIYFFENFKKQIQRYPDLRTVFPETYRVLLVLGDELYNYQRYLKSLRAAFQNDMRQLTKNFPSIIDNHPDFFERHPQLAATFRSSFYIAEALQDKVHPGDIINNYPAEYLDSLNINWKGSIQTLQLISSSLRDTSSLQDSAYWVSAKQVKELVKDKIAFNIYLGLLYQQAKTNYAGIHFKINQVDKTLTAILDSVGLQYEKAYTAYAAFIAHFSEKTAKLNQIINEYKNNGNDSTRFQHYYDYYSAFLDLFQHCTEISRLPFIKNVLPDLADTLKNYFEVVHSTQDLFLDIQQHNYTSAVVNTVHIYDLVKSMQGEADAANRSLGRPLQDTAKTFDAVKKNLLKYGSFLAAISEADKPGDVEKIIESFALPPGSARVKRQSMFNVALNAYAGLFVGNEMISGVDKMQPFKKFNSYGVTAPIGISISTGRQGILPFSRLKKFDGKCSHSLFISLVDLGAVAAYRFKSDTASQVPVVKLKDIFSPGLFWSIGIPKSPLSVNLGSQVGPNLRRIDHNSTALASEDNGNKTYLRFSISVCVDLPVLNFYTRN